MSMFLTVICGVANSVLFTCLLQLFDLVLVMYFLPCQRSIPNIIAGQARVDGSESAVCQSAVDGAVSPTCVFSATSSQVPPT